MSRYLTIAPSAGQPSIADTRLVVEFLKSLPELQQTGPVEFAGVSGLPWVRVILAKISLAGGYASDGAFIPVINIVEMVCSDSSEADWYDLMAGRIAAFLGWTAVEEHEGRQIWPPTNSRHTE